MLSKTEKKACLLTQGGRFSHENALNTSSNRHLEDVVDTRNTAIWQGSSEGTDPSCQEQVKYTQHEVDPIPVLSQGSSLRDHSFDLSDLLDQGSLIRVGR